MATRADLISIAALKRARAASKAAAVRPLKGDKGERGADGIGVVGPRGEPGEVLVVQSPAPDPVGIADVEVEQDDLDLYFVVTLSDGTQTRRKVKLPEAKAGKDGKRGSPGSFYVRGGIANNVQQVQVLANIADPSPTYAGVPLLVFRPTGAVDTYTMEIITS